MPIFTDELKEVDFKRLSSFIYQYYGINLYPAKRILLQSRLQIRLRTLGFNTYKQYCDFVLNLKSGHPELQEMIECVSTNKTEFFREISGFNFTNQHIVPEFFSKNKNKTFKIWSAGSSSGKEAHSFGMLLSDFAKSNPRFSFEILGSDISVEMLKIARMAIYSMDDINEIPIQYRKKYLLKSKNAKENKFRINSEIRTKIKYFYQNLLSEEYKIREKLDLILCRNTMIYFDKPTQEKIVRKFIKLLNPKSYLILGQSESLINFDVGVKQVAPSIYQKI